MRRSQKFSPFGIKHQKERCQRRNASLVLVDVVVLVDRTCLMATKGRRGIGGVESVEGRVEEETY
jgi:hypothetical protein